MKGYLLAACVAIAAIAVLFAAPSESKACDVEALLQLNNGYDVCDDDSLGLNFNRYSFSLNHVGHGSFALREQLRRERLQDKLLAQKLLQQQLQRGHFGQDLRFRRGFRRGFRGDFRGSRSFRDGRGFRLELRRGLFGPRLRIN